MLPLSLPQISKVLQSDACFPPLAVKGFSIDSRATRSSEVFFALQGKKANGAQFLKEVFEKGAIAAVVDKDYKGPTYGLYLIFVEDVLQALQKLARHSLEEFAVKVIAITGSVGKTSTKHILYNLLQGSFKVGMTPQNYNTEVGVPLALLNREECLDYYIVEMGMTQKGQIDFLVDLTIPYLSLITMVSYAHAENFAEGLSAIANAKAEIFSHPDTKIKIAPKPFFSIPFAITHTFSMKDKHASFFLKKTDGKISVTENQKEFAFFDLPFTEEPFYYNFLAAYAAARTLGVMVQSIQKAAANLTRIPGRFFPIQHKDLLLIDDTYNASIASIQAALDHLPAPKKGGKKVVVLGEMKELGSFSLHLHEEVIKMALQKGDHLFFLGSSFYDFKDRYQNRGKPVEFFTCKKELTSNLLKVLSLQDVVLLKGSRSLKMEEIREEIQEFIETC